MKASARPREDDGGGSDRGRTLDGPIKVGTDTGRPGLLFIDPVQNESSCKNAIKEYMGIATPTLQELE